LKPVYQQMTSMNKNTNKNKIGRKHSNVCEMDISSLIAQVSQYSQWLNNIVNGYFGVVGSET